MASTVRRKRKPAGSPIEPNQRVEDGHVRFMRGWAAVMNRIQREHWPEIRKLVEREQKRLGTRTDAARRDAEPKSIASVNSIMADMLDEYVAEFRSKSKKSVATVEGTEVKLESTSSDAWAANIESLVDQAPGLTAGDKTQVNEFLIDGEPDIPKSVRRKWIRDQLGLVGGKPLSPVKVNGKSIESLSGRSMKRMKSVVTNGILNGSRVEGIMKSLADIPGITARHAETIARDQVVKQNGKMTRIRHEALHVTHYTWQNVGDDRVRKTHKEFGKNGGQRYSYKEGAPGGINPAEEVLCRCWASPDLAGALAAAKKAKARGDMRPRLMRRLRPDRRIRAHIPMAPQCHHA